MNAIVETLTAQTAANLVSLFAALEPEAVASQPVAEDVAPALPAVKPFKSARAAKIAYGKAERAWEVARDARIGVVHAQRDPETKAQATESERAQLNALRAEYEAIEGDARFESAAFNAYCSLWNTISARPEKEARAIEDAAWAQMKAVYEQAIAQGFWVNSYHLGHNPTRDLIAANMD